MAYGIKYRFKFESVHGVDYTVNLLEDGYDGSVTTRPLGKAPVIRMQENGCFRSTSCNLTLECQVDGEFAELYTSDPLQFRIDVFRGDGVGTLIWSGFVATEIYSEPDIYPPYDVDVTATDGLGTLKEYDFPARGLQTVREHIRYFLSKTGIPSSASIYAVTSAGPTAGTPATLFDSTSIDLDYLAGENCYDAFAELLNTLHMTVTTYNGNWLLVRETDLSGKLNSSGALSVYSLPTRSGSSSSTSTTTISGVKKTIGKMGVADIWPVGHLTRRVVPAKRSVMVEAPYHAGNVLANPDMASDSVWEKAGISWNSGGYYSESSAGVGSMGQTVSVSNMAGTRLRLTVRASRNGPEQSYNFVSPQVWFQETGSTTTYWYDSENRKWTTAQPQHRQDFDLGTTNADRSLAEEFTVEVPELPIESATISGSLRFWISARNANIFSASVSQILNNGYRDEIVINNGTRGKGDTVRISGGRSDIIADASFWRGVFVLASNPKAPVSAWSDNRQYGKEFMSLTALDLALSFALPRISLSGRMDFPAELNYPPLVLDLRSTLFQMETFSWNLLEEEVEFTALSLPAVSLSVESETITYMGTDKSQASYSGGSSSGGGSTYVLPIASASTLGGVKVGSGLSIDGSTGVLSATGGGGGGITTESDPVFAATGEKTANKVTSLSSSSNDTQYPSAKCVYDIVGNIESLLASL